MRRFTTVDEVRSWRRERGGRWASCPRWSAARRPPVPGRGRPPRERPRAGQRVRQPHAVRAARGLRPLPARPREGRGAPGAGRGRRSLRAQPRGDVPARHGDDGRRRLGGGAARGERRPGHFRGVATVVLKLFGIAAPDRAYFGEKDAQQLAVVRRLVADLDVPVDVRACPIVREPDGLALSSRNAYLSPAERQAATVLVRALRVAEQAWGHGERRGDALRDAMRRTLESEPLARVDYASAADPASFREVEVAGRPRPPAPRRVRGRDTAHRQLPPRTLTRAPAARPRPASRRRRSLPGESGTEAPPDDVESVQRAARRHPPRPPGRVRVAVRRGQAHELRRRRRVAVLWLGVHGILGSPYANRPLNFLFTTPGALLTLTASPATTGST